MLKDREIIKKRYQEIINIITDTNNSHLGIIKDIAILSYVHGIQKKAAFVSRIKEEEEKDLVQEEIENEKQIWKEKEEKEEMNKITGGKNSFKRKSDYSVWSNIIQQQPSNPNQTKSAKPAKPVSQQKDIQNKISNSVNSAWANLDLSLSKNDVKETPLVQSSIKKQTQKPVNSSNNIHNNSNSNNSSRFNKRSQYQHERKNKFENSAKNNYNPNRKPKPPQDKSIKNQNTGNSNNTIVKTKVQQEDTPRQLSKPVNTVWTIFTHAHTHKIKNDHSNAHRNPQQDNLQFKPINTIEKPNQQFHEVPLDDFKPEPIPKPKHSSKEHDCNSQIL